MNQKNRRKKKKKRSSSKKGGEEKNKTEAKREICEYSGTTKSRNMTFDFSVPFLFLPFVLLEIKIV